MSCCDSIPASLLQSPERPVIAFPYTPGKAYLGMLAFVYSMPARVYGNTIRNPDDPPCRPPIVIVEWPVACVGWRAVASQP